MSGAPATGRELAVDALLHSYSAVLFARSRAVGALLLAATMVVPAVGLVGLAGVLLASGLALLLGLDRRALREGLLGYNALLVFLAMGALMERSAVFAVVAVAAALLTVVVHVGLAGALRYHLRLPVLSLPFVLVAWVLFAAVPHLRGVALVHHPPAMDLGALPGPAVVDAFLRSLGAIFFQPHWAAGALVLAALLWWSRIAVVHALVGFLVAWGADAWLLRFPPEVFHVFAGFNIVLTAVALGGVLFVPGPAALALAAGGALASALVTVGAMGLLGAVGLPVLALPLNLVVLITVYALRQSTGGRGPQAVPDGGGAPEANLARALARARDGGTLRLGMPVRGRWTVTPGVDGPHTHQGLWRHALDLAVLGADGRRHRGDGAALADHHCHRLPVVAPCGGTVLRVVDGVPDSLPGAVDTARNWGNLVLLHVAPDRYLLLAHLAPGSVRVAPGAVVVAGQELGRCGASGRAPAPHLHLQLQDRPEIGAPTVPIALSGVVTEGPGPARAWPLLTPAEGTSLRAIDPDAALRARLAWPIGGRRGITVAVDGGPAVPRTLVVAVDLMGRRQLRLVGRRARLQLEDRPEELVMGALDGEAPALVALAVALRRLPHDRALAGPGGRLAWTDTVPLRALRPRWGAWLADGLGALRRPPVVALDFAAQRGPAGLAVRGQGRLPGGEDVVTEAVVADGGLARVSLRVGRRETGVVATGGWR